MVYREFQEDILASEGGGAICNHHHHPRSRLVTTMSSGKRKASKNMYPPNERLLILSYVALSIWLASCVTLAANQTTSGVNETNTKPVAQVVLKVKPLNASTTTTSTTTTTTTLKPRLKLLASNGTQKVTSDARVFEAKSRIATKPVEVKEKKWAKNKKNNGTRTKSYGEQQEASLLRPLILRSLGLGGFAGGPNSMMAAAAQAQAAESQEPQQLQQGEEEEEEVTQTIYAPIKGSGESTGSEAGDSESSSEPNVIQQASSGGEAAGKGPAVLEAHGNPRESGHLKPEASLQLTSTEMSSLLNDRDGPEFYRERELQGDGVLVGEERPPLAGASSTAATSLGIHHMGYPNGLAHHDSYESDAFVANHRLAQAASGGGGYPGGDYSGFSHRFGSFGGEGGGDYPGRLMQSPNEYSEYHHGRFNGYPQGDYSAHSGLLRAGSGDFGGPHDGYGHSAGAFLGGGHRLEQHSSELYGGGYEGAGLHPELGGYYGGGGGGGGGANQRLLSAAAHHPGYGTGGSHLDDYTSRYGSSMGGFEHRGYAASQHSSVNALLSQEGGGGSKLMPLSPVVPVAEEIGGSASSAQQFKAPMSGERQKVEVEEPAEEQELPAGNDEAATSPPSSSSPSGSHDSSANDGNDDGASLVLNYPPPGSSEPADRKPSIEFSRFGSAGYLPPTASPHLADQARNNKKILKKMMPASHQQQEQSPGGSKSDYDPAENPAHAGKYIID